MTLGERSPSRPDAVFKQLVLDIMSGRYAAGQSLPSERALSEQLAVSRSVLREALKRVAQLGLITTQHGGSSRTNDYRRTAGLDLLGVLAGQFSPEARSPNWWLPLLEMRAAIGADAARLCALRATQEQRSQLLALSETMSRTQLAAEIFELEHQFWNCIIDGASNLAYRLAFNTMMKVVPGHASAAHQLSHFEVQRSGHRLSLASAIAAGDAERAEHEARSSLRRSVDLLTRLLDHAKPKKEARSETMAAVTVLGIPDPSV
jgi:GntR family transcriptional repressor for pyruvate dehydrogenase complex